jgi:hypothetical protein
MLQIRGVPPAEEPIRPPKPSKIVQIDISKNWEDWPWEDLPDERAKWDKKWMEVLRRECTSCEYVKFDDHPELSHWIYHMKGFYRPAMGPHIDLPWKKNNQGQSCIQESKSVESHNSQSSEGQLRKPTNVVKVDVTATFSESNDMVNARSDDLLALKAENQLELDLSGKAEVRFCGPEI